MCIGLGVGEFESLHLQAPPRLEVLLLARGGARPNRDSRGGKVTHGA